jgi:putative FmdB family regulatory protein
MPLYEYQCAKCGHRFEVLQRMGESGESLTCPECGADRPEKQLSTFASRGSAAGAAAGAAAPGCGAGGFT